MFAVAMLVAAGFAAGLAISVQKGGNVERRVVWTMWGVAAVALVIALVAFAVG